jgi:hypothetical protein
MSNPADDYKKALAPHIDSWGKQNVPLGKQLQELTDQLEPLEKIKSPTPEQLKKIKDLKAKRKAVCDKIVKAALDLGPILLKVPGPKNGADLGAAPTKPNPTLLQLPPWLNKIIKDKGIPLGDDVTVTPSNVHFDPKTFKLKSGGVIIKFKF